MRYEVNIITLTSGAESSERVSGIDLVNMI